MSYLDSLAFATRMQAYLTDPTYSGDLGPVIENIPLTAELNSENATKPFTFKDIDANDIKFAPSSTPYEFALGTSAALLDPTYFSDGTLRNYDIGLSAYLESEFLNGLDTNNPFNTALNSGQFKFTFNIDDAIKKINEIKITPAGTVAAGSIASSDSPANQTNTTITVENQTFNIKDKSDKGNFNNAVALIKAYGKKTNTSYDDKIEKIKKDMKGNYKTGLNELKKIIATFDKTKLYEVVKDIHHADYNNRQAQGKAISDAWADKIGNSTTGDFTVDTSNLNADNVLKVLGTYISNPKFQSGGMWNNLIKDNFDKISQALYANAEKYLSSKNKSISNGDRNKIRNAVNNLKSASTPQDKAAKTYALFAALRNYTAGYNDVRVYNTYANFIPQKNRMDRVELYEQNKFKTDEQKAYNSAPKLQANG